MKKITITQKEIKENLLAKKNFVGSNYLFFYFGLYSDGTYLTHHKILPNAQANFGPYKIDKKTNCKNLAKNILGEISKVQNNHMEFNAQKENVKTRPAQPGDVLATGKNEKSGISWRIWVAQPTEYPKNKILGIEQFPPLIELIWQIEIDDCEVLELTRVCGNNIKEVFHQAKSEVDGYLKKIQKTFDNHCKQKYNLDESRKAAYAEWPICPIVIS